ncbi:carbohydrate ABC transporter permease [Streptomyces bicolor]|uniref:carbohydrate ABC transporter permease n=1 Tax=Streptomyces bicolor TaxID=66874 RepID=UPI000997CE18|nr:sugar ABC transporter permease [Streptomyces bicolor]
MATESRVVTKGTARPTPGKPAGQGGFKSSPRYRTFVKYRFIAGFLAVPLALYAVLVVSPFIQTFYYALTDWTGYSSDFTMVGFDNFSKLFEDDLFWKSLQHNLVLLIGMPVLAIGMGLFFAFMLSAGGRHKQGQAATGVRGSKGYKILYFFPQVLSIAIVAVLWGNIYNPQGGLLNGVLDALGLSSLEQNWLGDPGIALLCVLAVMVWANVGFYVVLFSAAMGSIPKEIYEAALLDGASRVTTFFRVTLPLIRDNIQTAYVYAGIMALETSFAYVMIMTVNQGGPDHSTLVLPVYMYNKAFRDGQAGYATAVGVAMLVVTMIFAVLALSIGRRRDRLEF